MALSFRDRVVQWAIYLQLNPLFDNQFIFHSYGCRVGKGTTRAADRLQYWMQKVDRTPDECNNGWIQFEICEDGLTDAAYFKKVYEEACEITAYLCQLFGIDPNGTVKVNGVDVPTILCHADSHKLGLGSNHGDVNHWFPKHGKSMATVRADVAALLKAASPAPDSGTGTAASPGKTLKVGDIVTFTGSKHYANANAASGPACKPGKAKITRIYQLGKSKHPYHLVSVSGGGSNVYGWVDEADIKEAATESTQTPQKWTPKVGDVVNYSGSTH